ncbi:MAG TPA: serine/threonine protein kinase [Bacteroidetes bacterium]|nr:serine/threonine protein kinase [Bacteroidota bacterium]
MPNRHTHNTAAALFLRLAEASPAERDDALAAEPDPAVREAALALLRGHETESGVLDDPLSVLRRKRDEAEARIIGREVGPWRIVGRLGAGGMGAVYRAVRADGLYEREVALKLLAPGAMLAGGEWLARRLTAERRILARLEHPGIARLYDGGVSEEGVPYLVMEYVDGAPITAYADAHGLSVRARVALAARVCDAVAYAHQRLIVHRDLKPSNVLVGGPPETPDVKLLDFGIAKLLDQDEGLTRTRAALTPAYAAPEQVTGGEVTTATDVYALGVLLYRLLAGRRPYDLAGATAAHTERVITAEVPPPPSVAAREARTEPPLPTPAAASGASPALSPAARARALRGDLDTVVLRALEKEPARRYPTAQALGDDLRRHLTGLPVEARPATAAYRVGRFVRRHRVLAGAGLAVLAAVVSGAGLALWQAREARAEAARATAMQTFLVDMLAAANPEVGEGRDVRVADLLDQAAADLDSAFASQPEIRLTAHEHLGTTYYELGLLDEAVAQYRAALALAERTDGPRSLETARLQSYLATAYRELAAYDTADSLYSLALQTHRQRAGEQDLQTAAVLAEIGTLRYYTGDAEGSAEAHERVLAIEEALLPPGDPELVLTIGNLAVARTAQGREAEALALFERQVGLLRAMDQPVTLANALANLGSSYFSGGREEDAARVQREAVRLFREVLGDEHPSTAFGLSNYGSTLTALGRAADAEPLLREAVAIYRSASGERHPNVGFPLLNLAKALRDQGRLDEAERAAREAGDLFREGFGADHPVMERVTETLGTIHARR